MLLNQVLIFLFLPFFSGFVFEGNTIVSVYSVSVCWSGEANTGPLRSQRGGSGALGRVLLHCRFESDSSKFRPPQGPLM